MKRARFDKTNYADVAGFPAMKDRRKAYYHGKYNKEIFSILVVIAGVAMYIVRQGA
jgi:predicted metal-dependent peptidase